jgi:hypothetical protein
LVCGPLKERKKERKNRIHEEFGTCQSDPSQTILTYFGIWTPVGHETILAPNLVVPGHVVSEIRGVQFSGFPFEWNMVYNNLPCTTVQTVIALQAP